jgi:hypothetical protein
MCIAIAMSISIATWCSIPISISNTSLMPMPISKPITISNAS